MTTPIKQPKLTTKDKLAMYRNAFYSLMGAREAIPSDRQCLLWLKQVADQAQYKTNPKIGILAHEPQFVHSNRIVPKIELRQWDVVIPLPDWTELPK